MVATGFQLHETDDILEPDFYTVTENQSLEQGSVASLYGVLFQTITGTKEETDMLLFGPHSITKEFLVAGFKVETQQQKQYNETGDFIGYLVTITLYRYINGVC